MDGPYVSVKDVLAHLDGDKPELACAILDVRLRDGEVFPRPSDCTRRAYR